MLRNLVCVACALLLGCSIARLPPAPMQASTPGSLATTTPDAVIVRGRVAESIDAVAGRYSDYGWNFSLLVAQGGDVTLQKAYGSGLTPETVFDAASVAKQFTAAAIVKLASEGKLHLDDPMTRYFPGAPKAFEAITIDELLSHTSGMRDSYAYPIGFATQTELIQYLFSHPLESTPGAEWSYCNFCYGMLAIIVERASGTPFKRYLREALFVPAGLRNTGFSGDRLWLSGQRPYATGGTSPEYPREDRWGFGLGAGDVITSPADLFRWTKALQSGRIMPEGWRVKLDEPLKDVFSGLQYGRGWWNRTVELAGRERLNIWHSGQSEVGFSAWLSRYPADQLVTVFLSNQGYEGQPLREMLNSAGGPSVLEKLVYGGEVRLPPAVSDDTDLAKYEGTYRLDPGNWIDVRADPPFLEIVPHGQSAFNALLPSDAGKKAPEALAAATARTIKILQEVQKRRGSAPFIHDRDPESPLPREFTNFESFQVLGSTPIYSVRDDGHGLVVTYFVLGQNGSDHMWRMHWDKEDSGAVYQSVAPVQPRFRASGNGQFANWHPLLRSAAFVEFRGKTLRIGKIEARRD
jgi:CubicO group peptidase (beta-lactamase class C family)